MPITDIKAKIIAFIGILIAVAWSVFQLYTAGFGLMHIMIQRPLHVVFALMLTYWIYPKSKNSEKRSIVFDYLPTLLSLAIGIFIVMEAGRLAVRMQFTDPVFNYDIIFGVLTVILLLEACRRSTGIVLPLLALVFIVYGFIGPYLPGLIRHSGLSLESFVETTFLTANGIFSAPVGVSAEVVFYFILFGAFLQESGSRELFGDIAFNVTKRTRGGVAKGSVLASTLFGMISGSAVGNVAVTGAFTIPLMKKEGYKPHHAAAIEAMASTGGQIMPPIMGAAAFLLADMARIPYPTVVVAAIGPAILYYTACFLVVDFTAWKTGIGDVKYKVGEIAGPPKDILKRIHLVLPIILLIYMVMSYFSLMRSALFSTVLILVVSWIRKETRIDFKKLISAFQKGAKGAIMVAIPSAVAGIMVGIIVQSGLGLRFTSILITISGGNLFIALFLTMIACIILGMGMPTAAAYLLTAVLMAPALIRLGVPGLIAHLFVFTFAVFSMITPPVALSVFAAASIAESSIFKTGITAFRWIIGSFIVPFAFVYNNNLIFVNGVVPALMPFTSALLGVFLLSIGNIGFFYTSTRLTERAAIIICGLLLLSPGLITNILGFVPGAFILFLLRKRSKHNLIQV